MQPSYVITRNLAELTGPFQKVFLGTAGSRAARFFPAKPLLVVLALLVLLTLIVPPEARAQGSASASAASAGERSVVRLSPQVREMPRNGGYARIARAELNNFLLDNRLESLDAYERAPYIVANADDSLVIGAGDEVFVRGQWTSPARSWGIYRQGNAYVDPLSGESLGQELRRIGTAEIVAVEGEDIRRVRIRNSRVEVQPGDRLMLQDSAPLDLYFTPSDPQQAVRGRVVSLMGESQFAAQYDTVLLNLGTRDSIREGDLLTVFSAPDLRTDPTTDRALAMPEREAASVMIYRVFEKASYAVILGSTRPVGAGDNVAGP
jgi:hypothetical protein